MAKQQLNVRLEPAVIQALGSKARATGESQAAIVGRALRVELGLRRAVDTAASGGGVGGLVGTRTTRGPRNEPGAGSSAGRGDVVGEGPTTREEWTGRRAMQLEARGMTSVVARREAAREWAERPVG